jgi:dihydrofolate reductase
MKLILIAAVANNNVIGNNNQLLWNLPADLKHFKKITMGHTLIMGRKTYESIGKPLPGRKNIIITRNKDFSAEGCEVFSNLKDAICRVKKESDVFVIGGGEIYRQTINLNPTRRLYITRVFANFEGDSYFPEINPDKWELIEREEFNADEKNPFPFAFLIYKKKRRLNTPKSH